MTSHRHQRAFSLVELLVVIAIVGVLFSMMLPSLSQSRRLAENLKCSSISRGSAVTMLNYLDDMKGFIPPLATVNPDGTLPAWGYYYGTWYSFVRPWVLLGKPNGDGTYRGDDARLMCCTSKVKGTWTYGYPYFLYAMPWTLRYRVAGNPTTSWRLEELRNHANTGMFVDNGSYGDSIYWMSVPAQSQYTRIEPSGIIYTAQHDAQGFNQVFLDGHSEFARTTPEESLAQNYGPQIKLAHKTFHGVTSAGYLESHGKYTP